jgi:Major capsid protein
MPRKMKQTSRAYDQYMASYRAQAFDAAGASGLAFLNAQLELIDTDLVEPLQAVTHPRDITVETGGGFPQFLSAWSANYATTGTQFYGLQGTNNTELPEAQADVQKGVWATYIWAMGMTVTYVDLQRMEFALRMGQAPPFSLQELYENSVETNWVKALDFVTYAGFLGGAALINNPSVYEYVVPAGVSGSTTWAKKTPQEILADVNYGLTQTLSNSGYAAQEGMADRLLVPYGQFNVLTQPQAIAGVPVAMSTIEYIEKNCIAAHHGIPFKINPLPNPWISGQGSGNTAPVGQQGNGLDRAVFYKNDKKSLYLKIPQVQTKVMTVPTTRAGVAYETAYLGCIGEVVFKRTITMVYADGI